MSVNAFLATTGHGLARASRRASDEWSTEWLLADQDLRCLAADPLNREVIYAGTQGQGVLRSEDGGQTWQSIGLPGKIVKALAMSHTQPGTVYAGTKPARLFVSHDWGANWTELVSFRRIPSRWFWFSPAEKPPSAYVQAIALSPTDPATILVGIEFGAVVRSTDGGQFWSGHRRGALRDCHALTFHVTHGQASQSVGMLAPPGCSRRRGWTGTMGGRRRRPGPPRGLVCLRGAWPMESAQRAQRPGFHRPLDRRRRLANAGGWAAPAAHRYALLTAPGAPGHVYAGLANGEVWHSTDHGETWRRLPVQFGNIHRTVLLLP